MPITFIFVLLSSFMFNPFSSSNLQFYYKKRFQHRHFRVKFTKFLGAHNLKNICERLLLWFAFHWLLSVPNCCSKAKSKILRKTYNFALFRWRRTLTFPKNCFIGLNESPLKMMKNAFYFILKALFVLKIFSVDFLAMQNNSLIRKIGLTSKFMTSQPD